MQYQHGDRVRMTFCETMGNVPVIHEVIRAHPAKPTYFTEPTEALPVQPVGDEAKRIQQSLADLQKRFDARRRAAHRGPFFTYPTSEDK